MDVYNIEDYTDDELITILDLDSNVSDTALEAAIIQQIQKHMFLRSETGRKMFQFFKDVYAHFFEIDEDRDPDTQFAYNLQELERDDFDKTLVDARRTRTEQKKDAQANLPANMQVLDNILNTNVSIDGVLGETAESPMRPVVETNELEYAPGKINPILKETYTRTITIDSNNRDFNVYPNETEFTVNFSETLKDVVKMRLYAIQLPVTWYTISESFGSNFFLLKPREDVSTLGLLQSPTHQYKVEIEAGNYSNKDLVTTVNAAMSTLFSETTDVSFGNSALAYKENQAKAGFTLELQKTYTEFDYDISCTAPLREALGWHDSFTSPTTLYYQPLSIGPTFELSTSSATLQWEQYSDNTYTDTTPLATISLEVPTGTYTAAMWATKLTEAVQDSKDLEGDVVFSTLPTQWETFGNPMNGSGTQISAGGNVVLVNNIIYNLNTKNNNQYVQSPMQYYTDATNQTAGSIPLGQSRKVNIDAIYDDQTVVVLAQTITNQETNNTEVEIYTVASNQLSSPFTKRSTIDLSNHTLQSMDASGTRLATYNMPNETIEVYAIDPASSDPLGTRIGTDTDVSGTVAVLSGNGQVLAALDDQTQTLKVYSVGNSIVEIGPFELSGVKTMALNHDGNVLATISRSTETVHVYDLTTNPKTERSFDNPPSGEHVIISSDGNRLLITSTDKPSSLYDWKTNTWEALPVPDDVRFTQISSDGLYLLGESTDGSQQTQTQVYAYTDAVRGFYVWNVRPTRNAACPVPNAKWRLRRPNEIDFNNILPNENNELSMHVFRATASTISFDTDQTLTFVPRPNVNGGVYIDPTIYPDDARENDIVVITIPKNTSYTAETLIDAINTALANHPLTYGSSIAETTESSSNEFVYHFNINKMYTTCDYKLVFFDSDNFARCTSGGGGYRNATVDSTLGYILGFNTLIEYELTQENVLTLSELANTFFLNPPTGASTGSKYTYTETLNAGNNRTHSRITLEGNAVVSVSLYNYFMIILDDFNQNHLNDGLVTMTQPDTMVTLPSYANRRNTRECDPVTNMEIVSAPPLSNLTQKQIYSVEQILETQNQMRSNYSRNTSIRDMFALIPIKSTSTPGSIYVEFGGTLQQQERIYFGPVNIRRLSIKLMNDKGNTVDLNGGNWSFQLVCDQLYQH
jgi:hypothetical protein